MESQSGRLRLRRDRFGPGICNGATRSETLQFGTLICNAVCLHIRYAPTAELRMRRRRDKFGPRNSNGAMRLRTYILYITRHCNLVFVMLCVYVYVARHCNF